MFKKVIILITAFIIILSTNILANDYEPIKGVPEVKGEGEYIKYYDNYAFDIEKTGILEVSHEVSNSVSNIFLNLFKMVTYLSISLCYNAMKFDINDLFSELINSMQSSMMKGVFIPLFTVALIFTSWTIIKKLMTRDFKAIGMELSKVIFIYVLSILLMTNTSAILSIVTNLTKEVSLNIVNGVNDSNSSSFGESTSGHIWNSLIHIPYIHMESRGDKELAEEILKLPVSSSERREVIQRVVNEHDPLLNGVNTFDMEIMPPARLSFMTVYIAPFLIKNILFIALSLLQIAMQSVAIFYVLLAPIILILSMIESMGGMKLLTTWCKKIMESQIGILLLTFLFAFIIKLDQLSFSMSNELGFLVIIIMQVVIVVVLFFQRDKVLDMLTNSANNVRRSARALHNPYIAQRMLRNMGTGTYRPRRNNAKKNKPIKNIKSKEEKVNKETEDENTEEKVKPSTKSNTSTTEGANNNTTAKPSISNSKNKTVEKSEDYQTKQSTTENAEISNKNNSYSSDTSNNSNIQGISDKKGDNVINDKNRPNSHTGANINNESLSEINANSNNNLKSKSKVDSVQYVSGLNYDGRKPKNVTDLKGKALAYSETKNKHNLESTIDNGKAISDNKAKYVSSLNYDDRKPKSITNSKGEALSYQETKDKHNLSNTINSGNAVSFKGLKKHNIYQKSISKESIVEKKEPKTTKGSSNNITGSKYENYGGRQRPKSIGELSNNRGNNRASLNEGIRQGSKIHSSSNSSRVTSSNMSQARSDNNINTSDKSLVSKNNTSTNTKTTNKDIISTESKNKAENKEIIANSRNVNTTVTSNEISKGVSTSENISSSINTNKNTTVESSTSANSNKSTNVTSEPITRVQNVVIQEKVVEVKRDEMFENSVSNIRNMESESSSSGETNNELNNVIDEFVNKQNERNKSSKEQEAKKVEQFKSKIQAEDNENVFEEFESTEKIKILIY